MTESPSAEHIAYLENEVKKMDERIAKLTEMIPALEDARKKRAATELIQRLRNEAREYRKYVTLVKRFVKP